MIIKNACDRAEDIKCLKSLVNHPQTTTAIRTRILQQIQSIGKGVRGEKSAAYHINFDIKDSKNWAVIHDIRLENAGRVAQIDHILINRLMEIWVCESKYWAKGIAINEYGEFTSFYDKPIGIPSPLEQNRNHITLLQQMFNEKVVDVPLRGGMLPIKPSLFSAVLVSTNVRIDRPKTKIEGLESVMKADQFMSHVVKHNHRPAVSMFKAISSAKLETFASNLAEAHIPLEMNWAARFGLTTQSKPSENLTSKPVQRPTPISRLVKPIVDINEINSSPYPNLNANLTTPDKPEDAILVTNAQPHPNDGHAQTDAQLFASLKDKRMEIAISLEKPAFVVFSDKTLKDMVVKRPVSPEDMLNVSGIGLKKYELYGQIFLDVINS